MVIKETKLLVFMEAKRGNQVENFADMGAVCLVLFVKQEELCYSLRAFDYIHTALITATVSILCHIEEFIRYQCLCSISFTSSAWAIERNPVL